MNISEYIKKYRQDNHMTMQEFADRAGLSKGYISQLENAYSFRKDGKGIIPSIYTFQNLANAMDMNVNDLISTVDSEISLTGKDILDEVNPVSMDKIVFDDYFPLHYCTNLSAGSFDEILEAEADAVVYVPIKFQGRRRKLLAFQVNGTSMNNVIEDHSIVVVENTSTDGINYKDGTIIVAYCDGLVTVKRLYRQSGGNITLAPDSSDKTHLPIMINTAEQQLVIIGKVLWHMNPDDIAEKKY